MRHAGQLLFVLFVGLFCAAGYLPAQQSKSAANSNVAGRVAYRAAAQPTQSAAPQSAPQPVTVALLGAVHKPGIYISADGHATIGQLLKSAGGTTSESNQSIRIYVDAKSQGIDQIERLKSLPLQDGQVIYISPAGGGFSRTLSISKTPYRPVVITGLGTTPLMLNLGDESHDLEWLIRRLGQSIEVLGHSQFATVCPQRQVYDNLLLPNTIVHFPPQTVNNEGVTRALQAGLVFERPVLIETTPETTSPMPQAPPPPPARPDVPPVIRPAIPATVPPAKLPAPESTSTLLPGSLDAEIEPAGSSVPSHEPLRLPRFEDSDEEAEAESASPAVQPSRPPIMMRPEWSTFGEETGDEAEEGRKIERTSAGVPQYDEEIVLAGAELAVTEKPELAPTTIEASPATGTGTLSLGVESWLAIAVTLGVAALSIVVTAILSRDDRAVAPSNVSAEETGIEASAPISEAENDRRFLQRLIVNQVPLVEEDPQLPQIDHLHGIVIGGRRMVVHEAHETLAGPHFSVREPNDTRPLERRLRTVLRETSTETKRTEAAVVAAEPSHVRTATSPLERALRNVDRGGPR
jgi:hypothetical protein